MRRGEHRLVVLGTGTSFTNGFLSGCEELWLFDGWEKGVKILWFV
jgi:hypothetical protein